MNDRVGSFRQRRVDGIWVKSSVPGAVGALAGSEAPESQQNPAGTGCSLNAQPRGCSVGSAGGFGALVAAGLSQQAPLRRSWKRLQERHMSGAGCQLSTVPAHVGSTGTAPTQPEPRLLPGALPRLGVMLFHSRGLGHLVWDSCRGAFPARKVTHAGRGARSLPFPSCSLQETRPNEFFTSGSSDAF